MRIPGGIRVRLTLALTAIVAGALGTAYLIVVPSLERDLVDARLDQLEKLAGPLAEDLPEDRLQWPDELESMAVATNSRVVVFQVLTRTPPTLSVLADSRRRSSRDVTDDSVAREAVESGTLERGRTVDVNGDFADVAVPADQERVVLFRASLEDSLATVRLVQKRLLLATAFALALAVVLGLTAAGLLASRLRRLETAAERISAGDFGAPIVDRGDDEIGQLAVAFDRMRVRLAQLDTARKEFVANASHELRTPLFSLGGFLELLSDEDLDDETRREFTRTMQGQLERLTKLSTDLLDLSRVDAGQLSVEEEPVGLGEVARSLASELEHVANASGHVLEVDADDVWAAADEERVLQVGRALVVNALVHTPEGTRIVIRTRRPDDRAELAIEDDGPGIPAEHHEAVFERFYRVEAGGMASGSGLGLAIARELARLMGGSVRLESEPGRTLVTLDLPGEPAPEHEPVAARAFSRENGGNSTREP
jgi:signal transduction histidine kinase